MSCSHCCLSMYYILIFTFTASHANSVLVKMAVKIIIVQYSCHFMTIITLIRGVYFYNAE